MSDSTNLKIKSTVILKNNGVSVKEIAELLSVSTTRVYQLLKKDERRKRHAAISEANRKEKLQKVI